MPEVTTGQAALQLGCSPDTVRRKVQRGALQGRTDERGRLWVVLPDELQQAANKLQQAANEPQQAAPSGDLALAQELLAEVRLQRDALQVQLEQAAAERNSVRDALQLQLERSQQGEAELRRLLGNAQQQVSELVRQLPAPEEALAGPPERPEKGVVLVGATEKPAVSEEALKAAGVKGKKTRRRLLDQLGGLFGR